MYNSALPVLCSQRIDSSWIWLFQDCLPVSGSIDAMDGLRKNALIFHNRKAAQVRFLYPLIPHKADRYIGNNTEKTVQYTCRSQ